MSEHKLTEDFAIVRRGDGDSWDLLSRLVLDGKVMLAYPTLLGTLADVRALGLALVAFAEERTERSPASGWEVDHDGEPILFAGAYELHANDERWRVTNCYGDLYKSGDASGRDAAKLAAEDAALRLLDAARATLRGAG